MAEVQFKAIKSVYNVTVSSSALTMTGLGFAADDLVDVDRARVSVETADIKMTDDGIVPTATRGHTLSNGFDGMFQGQDLINALQFIRKTSDAIINVTLYKRT